MLSKNCAHCGTPYETNHTTSEYCSDRCRNKAFKLRNAAQRNGNLGTIEQQQPKQQSTMTSTAEFLLQQRITELKETIGELKSDKKQLETKLETEREKRAQLEVQVNTIKKEHAQELSGVEAAKRSLVSEVVDIVKSKEAMDGIANMVAAFKGADPKGELPAASNESDGLKAVRIIFSSLSPDAQNTFIENLHVYSQRPDLLTEENNRLKQLFQ